MKECVEKTHGQTENKSFQKEEKIGKQSILGDNTSMKENTKTKHE